MKSETRAVLVGLTIALLSCPALCDPAQSTSSISRAEFSIAGFSLVDNSASASSLFGSPRSVVEDATSTYLGFSAETVVGTTYHFDGVEIYFLNDEAHNLKCRTSRYSTPSGLKVGQPVASATKLYGSGERVETKDGISIRYNVSGTDCYLVVWAESGVITEIELWFDFT